MAQSFVEDHMHLCTKYNFNLLLFSFTTVPPNFGLIYIFLTEKRYTLQTLNVLSKRLHVQMHTLHTLDVLLKRLHVQMYTLQTLDVLSKRLHVQMHTLHTLDVI
jgi:hypothetical protein